MAPGGAPQKSAPPRPPDKGSFPLDHFKECSDAKAQYMQCLKAHGMRTEVEECRRLSAAYLQCRMDTQLMAPQPINRLGFEEAARQAPPPALTTARSARATASSRACRRSRRMDDPRSLTLTLL